MSSADPPSQLFDISLLAALDLSAVEKDLSLKSGCTALSPGPGLRVRPLSVSDYSAGMVLKSVKLLVVM